MALVEEVTSLTAKASLPQNVRSALLNLRRDDSIPPNLAQQILNWVEVFTPAAVRREIWPRLLELLPTSQAEQ